MKSWTRYRLADAVDINPPRPCKKGAEVKFVSMADLKEFNKKVQGFATRKLSGGSRFANGDTLMARITPCLENGKIAFVDFLDAREVAGGSTEFIVLSEKSGVSTDQFVYYLATSPVIRQKAIQAMSGTSGRQRVETDVFKNIEVRLPSIPEQKAIAKILGDLDAKIELNQQMNKTLEAMAQALFKEWFVDFRFPGHEKVRFVDDLPEGWRMGALGELISIESGKRPGEKFEVITDDFRVPLIGASSVMGYVKDALYKEPILIIGRVGTHGIVQRVSWPAFPSDNTLVIRPKAHEYVYQLLRMIDYQSLNVGTTQPLITQTAMKNFVILIPAGQVLEKFEKCVSNLFEKIVANNCETESLIGLRDSLLPKLMSGKITV